MYSVITGDIIDSQRYSNPDVWLLPLKSLLSVWGSTPLHWEIYRGDSFQLEILQAEEALLRAVRIKAAMRCIKGLDVRMAIGIGEMDYAADRISESNGSAFVYSGRSLDKLKGNRQRLMVRSANSTFDWHINTALRLALIAMDGWTTGAAELMSVHLANPDWNQAALGAHLGVSQPSISDRLKRAHAAEIMELLEYYRKLLSKV